MGKSTFKPFEFQQCTADWAIQRLFGPGDRAPAGRVLVADEVGLGKTIVTRQVCDHLREKHPHKYIQIVYMSSSLDICSQNKSKLAHAKEELVTADRITLLHAHRIEGARTKVTIFSMTPGTSIQISNQVGNCTERLYIAWLARKLFGFSLAQAGRVFALEARSGFKKRFREATFVDYQPLPRMYWEPLKSRWRGLEIDGRKVGELVRSRDIDRPTARKAVKALRKALVEVLLDRFSPDLIILDEFQRFKRGLLDVKDEGGLSEPLAARLLKPSTPTLLLSATPYRLLDVGAQPKPGELLHQEDLQHTLAFLLDSHREAEGMMESLIAFGNSLLNLRKETIGAFHGRKVAVERAMKRIMARTERVNFQQKDLDVTTPLFLSDRPERLVEDELYEYLALSRVSSSPSTLLSYWKSGSSLLSFAQDYKLHEQWVGDRRVRHDARLWARFGKNEPRNVKLRYLIQDMFGEDGASFNYLWIPPTIPYYPGTGIFDPKVLGSRDVKKGLIFSAWRFVPRMIAGEVSHRRRYRFRRSKPRTNPLRATPVTWARFYFPSRLLVGALSHADFVHAGSYKKLHAVAAASIRRELERMGVVVRSGATGRPWHVLRYVDCQDEEAFKVALAAYRKKYHQGQETGGRKGRSFEERYLATWMTFRVRPEVNARTIAALARMAIASPSVCILRALELRHGRIEVGPDDWRCLLEFCIHDLKNYLNRSVNQEVISSGVPKGAYADRVEAYLTAGNFQALMDEYLYLVDVGSRHGPVRDSIDILRMVMGGGASSVVTVPVSANKKNAMRIGTDVAVAFGERSEAVASRDCVRVAFNSPFWPMALATTSIGQEGLDFHLYCKDIYHWNLPGNPVAFEQREGRINRFNSLMVRRNMVSNQLVPEVRDGESLWMRYFEEAPRFCVTNDRYNLGLSPHWIYTPERGSAETTIRRHVLDVPHSGDRARYEILMTDLTNYRLAIGQPDQASFLEKVRDNPYLRRVDTRGLMLNLFPAEFRQSAGPPSLEEPQLRQLLRDARKYLDLARGHARERELRVAAESCIRHLEEYLSVHGDRRRVMERRASHVAEALQYFVQPHDRSNDRIPEIGFDDDIGRLRSASRDWKAKRRGAANSRRGGVGVSWARARAA